MFEPGGFWGFAVVAGTVLLGLALGYGMFMAPRRRGTPDGTPRHESQGHRSLVILGCVLFVMGALFTCWWLLRATPGVN